MRQIKLTGSTFEPREGYERSVLLTSDDFGKHKTPTYAIST